jgi:hypothetical protein
MRDDGSRRPRLVSPGCRSCGGGPLSARLKAVGFERLCVVTSKKWKNAFAGCADFVALPMPPGYPPITV